MADLVTAIKRIVQSCLENDNPSDVAYATYTGAGLRIDGKPNEVPADMVDIPLHLQTVAGLLSCDLAGGLEGVEAETEDGKKVELKRLKLTDAPVTIKTGLAPGARVAVVQKRGANRYSIMNPLTDILLSDAAATAVKELEAWGYVSSIKTGAGSITARCLEDKPAVNLNLRLKVVK